MKVYIYKIILINLKRVWLLFMVLTPLMAFISWLAVSLPRINYPVYYLNLISVFTYPFIAIIAIKYSWQYYQSNQLSRAVIIALLPTINILTSIICFNHMQYV